MIRPGPRFDNQFKRFQNELHSAVNLSHQKSFRIFNFFQNCVGWPRPVLVILSVQVHPRIFETIFGMTVIQSREKTESDEHKISISKIFP